MNAVDSPPGMTSPSSPSSCSGLRTSTTSAPRRRSIAACSRKFPCTARTPIRSGSIGGNGSPGAKLRSSRSLAVLLALASSVDLGRRRLLRRPRLAAAADARRSRWSRRRPGSSRCSSRSRSAAAGSTAARFALGLLAGLGGGARPRRVLQGALARDDEHRLADRRLRRRRAVRDLDRNRRAAVDRSRSRARRSRSPARCSRRSRSGARTAPEPRPGGRCSRSSRRARSASSPTSSGSAAARAARSRRSSARASARWRCCSRSRAGRVSAAGRPRAGSCRSSAIGLCDVGANALFALASGRGAALARVGARLALPGDDGRARPRSPRRAADRDADRGRRRRARGSRRAERRLSTYVRWSRSRASS